MCLTFCPTCVAAASTVTPQADSPNTLDYAPYVPERDGPLSEMASRAFMLAPSMSDIWTLRSGRRPLFLVDSIPIGTGTTRGDSTIPAPDKTSAGRVVDHSTSRAPPAMSRHLKSVPPPPVGD